MRIQITLHHVQGDCTLFNGRPEECPPIPRPGDLVQCGEKALIVEGIQHVYKPAEEIEIQLLA
jgi:hypothetical protein